MQYFSVTESPSLVPQGVKRGDVLFVAQGVGPVWRVLSGAFRLDCQTHRGESLMHLALPGDWMGVEALYGAPYGCTVTALVDSQVQAESMVNLPRMEALAAVVRQQQRQMLDMAPLRSGPVVARLQHLLELLGRRTDGGAFALDRKGMPRLKQTAQIIDTAAETVCREMKRLLPARPRRSPRSGLTVPNRQPLGLAASC